MTELPKLDYEVTEEQPPYSTGHQCLKTFTKLFIHNLDFTLTREGVLRTFNQYGRIKHINLPYDERNRARGLAFIIFKTHSEAKNALEAGERGIVLKNRILRVEVFKPLETLQMERKDKSKVEIKSGKTTSEKDQKKEQERLAAEAEPANIQAEVK